MESIIEKFSLKDALQAALREHSSVVKTFRVDGFNDDPSLPDDSEISLTIRRNDNDDPAQLPSQRRDILERLGESPFLATQVSKFHPDVPTTLGVRGGRSATFLLIV